jgi:hypothetical protein
LYKKTLFYLFLTPLWSRVCTCLVLLPYTLPLLRAILLYCYLQYSTYNPIVNQYFHERSSFYIFCHTIWVCIVLQFCNGLRLIWLYVVSMTVCRHIRILIFDGIFRWWEMYLNLFTSSKLHDLCITHYWSLCAYMYLIQLEPCCKGV